MPWGMIGGGGGAAGGTLGAVGAAMLVDTETTYDDVVLEDSPLGFWPMSEVSGTTLFDATGNSRNMTLSGTYTLGTAGPDGVNSVSFSSGEANSTTGGWVNTGQELSVELWFKTSTGGALAQRDSASPRPWTVNIQSGKIYAFGDNSSGPSKNTVLSYNDNKWHQVVWTVSSGAGNIYVDGVNVLSYSDGGTIPSDSTLPIRLGKGYGGLSDFIGSMCRVSFYDYALNPLRVAVHYAKGVGIGACIDEILADAPYGYWSMDELSGSVMADSSGNSRNGSYSGGITRSTVGPSPALQRAVLFDGSTGYAQVPSVDLSVANVATVEFWAKFPVWTVNGNIIIELGSDYNPINGFALHTGYSPATLNLAVSHGGSAWRVANTPQTSANTWQFFSAVLSRESGGVSMLSLRSNGAEVALSSVANGSVSGVWSGPQTLNIMARDGSSRFVAGSLAGLTVYPSRLSDARRDAHFFSSTAIAKTTNGQPPSSAACAAQWWADDLVAVGDGNPVGSWVDRVGGIEVTSSGTSRPTFDADGIGGKPSVNFDGSNDYLTSTSKLLQRRPKGAIVAVIKGCTGHILAQGSGGYQFFYLTGHIPSSSGRMVLESYDGGGSVQQLRVTTAHGSDPRVIEFSSDAAVVSGRVDNGPESLVALSGSNYGYWTSQPSGMNRLTLGALYIGSGFQDFNNGRLAFLGVYDQPLSSTDRDNLYGWINDTYGI